MKLSHIVAATCLLPSIGLAQTDRELGSHEHGADSLNIAIENTLIYVEFEAPWNSFVGFEHAPSTSSQRDLVEATLTTLRNPDEIFIFNGVDCKTLDVEIENSMDNGEDHQNTHDEEHDEEHGEEHDEEHAHTHDSDSEHAEHSQIIAIYSFECLDTSRLDSIDFAIFSRWEGFADLDVQLISEKGAASVELTASNARLDLDALN